MYNANIDITDNIEQMIISSIGCELTNNDINNAYIYIC